MCREVSFSTDASISVSSTVKSVTELSSYIGRPNIAEYVSSSSRFIPAVASLARI